METEKETQELEVEDPSNKVQDQTQVINQMNELIGFNYDTTVVGNISKDNEYANPDNNEFIWPEGYIRINTVRWADSVQGVNAKNPMLHVESFDGKTMNLDIIDYRNSKEEYEKDSLLITPIVSSFLDSPFCDPEMVNRETQRYLVKLDEERIRYEAFKKTYDPEENRLFEEWKQGQFDEEGENTNFDQVNPKSVWELLSEATTEDLFKFKLDIFEQEVVQNSEDRELRSKIRKAKSICEVCAAYQTLLDNESDKSNEE